MGEELQTGNWVWDVQNTYPSGLNFGPGWRFMNSRVFNPDWGSSHQQDHLQ